MLKKLLSQSSYWIINKDLSYKLGFEPTLLLTHLIDCADMLDQPFYQQRDRILNSLGWSEHQYRKSVKTLKDYNLIDTQIKGIPPKNYWTINERELLQFINQDAQDKSVKSTHPNQREIHAPNKVIKKNNNNNPMSESELIGCEGGRTLEEFSPTNSQPNTHKEGGWEKLVKLYPTDKLNGEMDAIVKWNNLTQEDKQKVFRHLKVYLMNTEPKYIKQIGNYFNDELWNKMKEKKTKYEGMKVIDCLSPREKTEEDLYWEEIITKIKNDSKLI